MFLNSHCMYSTEAITTEVGRKQTTWCLRGCFLVLVQFFFLGGGVVWYLWFGFCFVNFLHLRVCLDLSQVKLPFWRRRNEIALNKSCCTQHWFHMQCSSPYILYAREHLICLNSQINFPKLFKTFLSPHCQIDLKQMCIQI